MSPLPTPLTCPLRIMCMTSYPWSVRPAVSMEKKPIPGLTNRLMRAMVLLDQIVEIFDLPQLHAFRKYPGGFELSNRFGRGRVLVDSDHTRCWRGGVGGCRSRGLFHLLLDQTRPRS